MEAVMGQGAKIRLFKILNMFLAGISINETGRIMGISGALACYHMRALKIFSRLVLNGTPAQDAWIQACPALNGKLAGGYHE